MLNISQTKLISKIDLADYPSGKRVMERRHYKYFNRFLTGAAIACIIVLFLPWTQNVTGNGFVTTLTPDQRPQTIQSQIPGRIEQWYVREGDFVAKGDTILRISEVKSEYFDPNIVQRTGQQIDAKSMSVLSYGEKVKALDRQIDALNQERELKLEQARNKLIQSRLKVQSDSIGLVAAQTNIEVAETQIVRAQTFFDEGIGALKDVEDKRLKKQETERKLIAQQNKLLESKNEVLNAKIELNKIRQEYSNKISKSISDRATAQSSQFDTEAQVSKLETDRTNYQMRNDLYFITAPQNGYVNKAIIAGLGETFKEGQALVNVMPADYDLAVETFVEPLDLPLMHLGEEVRVQFDGWPAIVFSGWPNVSYGTYGAKVVAVETFISENGKYRILLAPDENDHPWPTALRAGSGAYTIALLEDVPIWYELWRRLNGFPPNYYQPKNSKDADKKKK